MVCFNQSLQTNSLKVPSNSLLPFPLCFPDFISYLFSFCFSFSDQYFPEVDKSRYMMWEHERHKVGPGISLYRLLPRQLWQPQLGASGGSSAQLSAAGRAASHHQGTVAWWCPKPRQGRNSWLRRCIERDPLPRDERNGLRTVEGLSWATEVSEFDAATDNGIWRLSGMRGSRIMLPLFRWLFFSGT